MQAAKDAVKNFTSKHGSHDTTVHEKVAPAVTNETITRQNEERVTTALDKEVHQDHHHTTVQPVKDREVLPEQHHHRMAGVEHRSYEHGSEAETKERLAAEAAQFKDTRTRVEGQNTQTINPTAAAEHVHHHVHETIQPVVDKQVIEPHVVHSTVPIHEVHHNAPQHHATSALPAVSMGEFREKGGDLTGRGIREDAFEGCPKHAHDGASSTTSAGGISSATTGSHTHGTSGISSGDRDSELTDRLNSSHIGGRSGNTSGVTGTGAHSSTTSGAHSSTTSTSGTTGQAKPSLLNKLNPMTDSNGDGKPGFMK